MSSKKKSAKDDDESKDQTTPNTNNGTDGFCLSLTPSAIVAIIGLLTGVLVVDSVLVGRDQRVEIVLTGSLKEPTQMDKMVDAMGSMPFADVMNSIINRMS